MRSEQVAARMAVQIVVTVVQFPRARVLAERVTRCVESDEGASLRTAIKEFLTAHREHLEDREPAAAHA